jgi:hypothetical protein
VKYSIEDDPSNPGKFQVRVPLPNGREILFTQLVGEVPSQEEFDAWVERYQEEASKRLKGDPLIVDGAAERSRPKGAVGHQL